MTLTDQLAALADGESLNVRFSITQEDIDQGIIQDCWDCPAAIALRRVVPGLMPEVGSRAVDLYEDDKNRPIPGLPVYIARTPTDLAEFIAIVDNDWSPQPGTFILTFSKYPRPDVKDGGPR